jgi:hypothetical protein
VRIFGKVLARSIAKVERRQTIESDLNPKRQREEF